MLTIKKQYNGGTFYIIASVFTLYCDNVSQQKVINSFRFEILLQAVLVLGRQRSLND